VGAVTRRVSSATFVGRGAELDLLSGALERAAHGRPAFVTNKAIGETLFMSEKTASVHLSRILAKLGVGGRVEAAAVAHRLGLAGAARA
jgi:DNA-binding CsgD family transcriptional regulator